jgi:hypothetical protein
MTALDTALAARGLPRRVGVIVPSFISAALVGPCSDLVALTPGRSPPMCVFFGLPGVVVVAKDFHVLRAIRAITSVHADLLWRHGTRSLAQTSAEDVDFEIVRRAAATGIEVVTARS